MTNTEVWGCTASFACSALCSACYAGQLISHYRWLCCSSPAELPISFQASLRGHCTRDKGTGSLSPGGGKAALTAWLLGKAINSKCQLALKNNFCFPLLLHLPPKCSQHWIAGAAVLNSDIFVDSTPALVWWVTLKSKYPSNAHPKSVSLLTLHIISRGIWNSDVSVAQHKSLCNKIQLKFDN